MAAAAVSPEPPHSGVEAIRQELEAAQRPLEWTDDQLAMHFAGAHPGFRYVATEARWLRWEGSVWRDDATLAVWDAVRVYLRFRIQLSRDANVTRRVLSAQTVAAVERLARSDPRYALTSDRLDADDWLLGTPAGVVDLRTGSLLDHDPGRYISMQTSIGPKGECPTWLQFLAQATDGDVQLQAYLQRVCGYLLTGSTVEHCLFFLYGTGRNGKSTFLNALAQVLGDYHKPAPVDAFTETRGERHPTELAMLRGARVVIAHETDEGKRWAESRIKALTGGDPIAARFMRGDFFTFTPKFKLLFAGNFKPRLGAVDTAIRRRIHLVPFTRTVAPAEVDHQLPERLRQEAAGILNWAIAGCLEYQATGLAPPERVLSCTEAYFEAQDLFGAWLEESCLVGPEQWEQPTRLYRSWCQFADQARERPGRKAEFSDRLESLGFTPGRDASRGGRYWKGLSLKPTAAPADYLDPL